MNRRNLISLWLLVVYLAATGGVSFASLSCRCATRLTRPTMHHCACTHCARHRHAVRQSLPAAGTALSAPCCSDRHSTEIDLYTSGNPDRSERHVRCQITDLPDGLAAECPCPAHVPALRHPALPRPAPPLTDCVRQPRGLRAPPALV